MLRSTSTLRVGVECRWSGLRVGSTGTTEHSRTVDNIMNGVIIWSTTTPRETIQRLFSGRKVTVGVEYVAMC